ncbi:MAG: DNA helicase RecQ [Desulfovibrionaceae bacterium]
MTQPLDILRSVFGYRAFLGLQENIIDHVMRGGDAVALMPTGSGKSLTYQIPSMLRQGTGVVVSPLIALMRDQVQGLTQAGVRAAYCNSSLAPREAADVEARLARGELDLIYVAPERLLTDRFMALLDRVPLALFAIDEAHCVSQWGHDFRPEYTQLAVLADRYPGVPRMALTATADGPTRNDILAHLRLGNARIFSGGFDRPNIRYGVIPKDHSDRQLERFIREEHAGEAGIVYRMSRKKTEDTAAKLMAKGIKALPYHAGLSPAERARNQERFMLEEGLVMVATVAFGMGVDKPNVRFVAHLDPPKSLEAYHQETGRAGRDGLPAEAWMTYGMQDVLLLRRMLESGEADTQRKWVERHKLNALLGFCETASCRRQALLAYFGEHMPHPCGNCDNCLAPVATWDGTVAAQKALSCIYRTEQRFGVAHLVDVLRGNATKRVAQFQHDRIKTFGVGADLDEKTWSSVFRQLTAAGLVQVDMERFGGLRLTEASWEVLRGEREVHLRHDPRKLSKTERRSRREKLANSDAVTTDEARALWERLRETRYALSKAQGVPPYAVLPDRTLLEMVRYRPEDRDGMARLSGMGLAKQERFSDPFLEALAAHRAEHGVPDDLPPLPEPIERTPKRRTGLNDTERETVALFRDLRDVAAVAAARDRKSGTIWAHLGRAVACGELTATEATGLPAADVAAIEDVLRGFQDKGVTPVTPTFDHFQGKYPYDMVRCVGYGLRRGDAAPQPDTSPDEPA